MFCCIINTNSNVNNEKNSTEKLDINYLPNPNYKRNDFLESIKINENRNIMNLKIKYFRLDC